MSLICGNLDARFILVGDKDLISRCEHARILPLGFQRGIVWIVPNGSRILESEFGGDSRQVLARLNNMDWHKLTKTSAVGLAPRTRRNASVLPRSLEGS